MEYLENQRMNKHTKKEGLIKNFLLLFCLILSILGFPCKGTRLAPISEEISVFTKQKPTHLSRNLEGLDLKVAPQPSAGLSQPTAFNKLAKGYVRDMEARSGLKIPESQRLILKQQLKDKKFEKLPQEQYAGHKKQYTDTKAEQIRQEWEKNTGQKWPNQLIEVNKNGHVKTKERPAQIHHIIPQQYGGPHEWWNAHPLLPSQHQGGVHGSGSTLNQIIKNTTEQ